jgi:uracil-DNA glycosylase
MSLAELLPTAWRTPLSGATRAPAFAELERFLESERATATVFPPREHLFAALAHTPPERVKVVLLGQDPYPTAGNANGLAFSVSPGVKVPASLKNIFLGLQADLGLPVPAHGDLTAWARRGVLLLNTVLTVREGEPQSHRRRGWEPFTRAVLEHVAGRPERVVFLCLGKPAQGLVESLGTRHPVVVAPHPSPLNGRKFVDAVTSARLFSQVNALLDAPLDWSL